VPIRYLTVAEVVETHDRTVEVSGGGLHGMLHPGRLESALEHMQNDDYYPTLADKLAHLFFSLATGHCFLDGNKRIAITATVHMLLVNGYMAIVARFMTDMENITVQVAREIISKDLLCEIIEAHLNLDPDNEEMKMKILAAIEAAPLDEH
jgi:death on curing protein